MELDYSKSADFRELQPLRIPAGWSVGWNTLSTTSKVEDGDFGGSSIFHATNSGRRFMIDVEFRPEFDPSGQFYMTVSYISLGREPKRAGESTTSQFSLMPRLRSSTLPKRRCTPTSSANSKPGSGAAQPGCAKGTDLRPSSQISMR